jgi:CheY-like chemotaxis protein
MKLKLLQIDDDSINNMANERLLKKMGVELDVINFLNPSEAINFLTNSDASFDLMLLDIKMPLYSGWEFLEKYAVLSKKMPIVMLTTSLDPRDQNRALEHSLLHGFYSKPLTRQMLIEIFHTCQIPCDIVIK